jgi:hypothetical protein
MHCSLFRFTLVLNCPRLETVGLEAPACYIRDFFMFNVSSLSKNCPSARRISAANVVHRDTAIFGTQTVSLNHMKIPTDFVYVRT